MQMTPELAEFCGIHAGDGYMRKRGVTYEVDISGSLEEQEYYDEYVIPLVNKLFGTAIKGRAFFPRGTYGFRTHDKNIAKTLNEQGFPFGSKTLNVHCPESILVSNDETIHEAFLRGFFDTDGCVCFAKRYGTYQQYKKEHQVYPRILLTTCSERLAGELCTLLNSLCFLTRCYKREVGIRMLHPTYGIHLNGKIAVEHWMNTIGTSNPVKESKYLLWKKMGFCPPNTTHLERLKVLKGDVLQS